MKVLLILAMVLIGCGSDDSGSSSSDSQAVTIQTDEAGKTISLDGRYYTECFESNGLGMKSNMNIEGTQLELISTLFSDQNCFNDVVFTFNFTRNDFVLGSKSPNFTNGYKLPLPTNAQETHTLFNEYLVSVYNDDGAYGYVDWKLGVPKDTRHKNYDHRLEYEKPEHAGTIVKINEDGSLQVGETNGPLDENDYPVTLSEFTFKKQ